MVVGARGVSKASWSGSISASQEKGTIVLQMTHLLLEGSKGVGELLQLGLGVSEELQREKSVLSGLERPQDGKARSDSRREI